MNNKKQFIIIISLFALTTCFALAQNNNDRWGPPNTNELIQLPQQYDNVFLEKPAYSENPLPPQVNLNLVFGGSSFSNPNDELLKTLYGDDYEKSVYYRTKEALQKDIELSNHITKLQKTRNNNIQVNVHYDRSDKLFPGETITYFDKTTGQFKSERVIKGDTVDTVAARMGITKTQLLNTNKKRFNLHPHARWANSSVNIGETASYYTDEQLKETIAHEVAHTVDGTVTHFFDYGNDKSHTMDEVTDRRTAWIEGWAEYNGGIFNTGDLKSMSSATCNLRRETEDSSPDDPIYDPLVRVHFMTTLRNEGTVAAILTNIDGKGANRDKILDVFKAGNQNWQQKSLADRDIVSFTRDYMEANPDQTIRTMLAIDCATRFKADNARLEKLFGPLALEYLKVRDKYRSDYYAENQLDPDFCNNTVDFFAKWDGQQMAPTNTETDTTEVQLDPMTLLNQNS